MEELDVEENLKEKQEFGRMMQSLKEQLYELRASGVSSECRKAPCGGA